MMNKIVLLVFQIYALNCFAMDSINITDIEKKVRQKMKGVESDDLVDKEIEKLIKEAKNNKDRAFLLFSSTYNIPSSGWERIASAISENNKKSNIEKIILQSSDLDDMKFGAFVMNLPELPELRSVNLYSSNVTEDSLAIKMIQNTNQYNPTIDIVRPRM